jgi:hypothetical protein
VEDSRRPHGGLGVLAGCDALLDTDDATEVPGDHAQCPELLPASGQHAAQRGQGGPGVAFGEGVGERKGGRAGGGCHQGRYVGQRDGVAVADIQAELLDLAVQGGQVPADPLAQHLGGIGGDRLAALLGGVGQPGPQAALLGQSALNRHADLGHQLVKARILRPGGDDQHQRGGVDRRLQVLLQRVAVGADEGIGIAHDHDAPGGKERQRPQIVEHVGQLGGGVVTGDARLRVAVANHSGDYFLSMGVAQKTVRTEQHVNRFDLGRNHGREDITVSRSVKRYLSTDRPRRGENWRKNKSTPTRRNERQSQHRAAIG